MSIYRIHPDRLKYQLITISSEEVLSKLGEEYPFHIDPTPRSYIDIWNPLKIDFYDSSGNKKLADLPDITVDSGRLFLNEIAYDGLKELLASFGEFLPVMANQKTAYIFNPLAIAEHVDGLNIKLSIKNEWGDLESLAFHEDKVKDMTVFRSEFDGCMGLFCQDAFKNRVEALGLKGVTFSMDLANIFPPDPSACTPVAH